ncbi:DUF58 domain-containing protein [Nocardioides panaciterrulae]|uniref:Uncharacterized protein (DUF58 family) n=1 Tax=Nocardioides panaciterrulae TaxID=661492 RepID=A0A7Y9J9T8_9ACTN|nr:DUF58 domain-containing protein [Nocardioides panaciterrulae]NYD41005.1 uncharacterized protein (DUF58 family) [Nocardioides panaciterrulae]
MDGWRPTAALGRALGLGGLGTAVAVLFGEPVIMVLTAPFLLLGALGLVHRPRSAPRLSTSLDHVLLHEGQGTTSRLHGEDLAGVEHATRLAAAVPHVALQPSSGRVGRLVGSDGELPALEVGPRRFGRRQLGADAVALTSRWAGYRWGPVILVGSQLQALPVRAPFDSRAEAPQPLGLVGAHRSRRPGEGTELASIRPFQTGDRLRRIHWRVSLRSDALHVVSTRGEEDSAVLLLVDALADHGRSGGLGGEASSLDVSVRAAAAVAEHHVRVGDRVGLRVVGTGGESVGYGTGQRHLQVLLGRLAGLQVGTPRAMEADRVQLRAEAGTVVIVLSPMLSEVMASVTATLVRRGLPVLVVDTLPEDAAPAVVEGTEPAIAALAWRMRRVERREVLDRLAALGCPVVPWRGPGTLDDVLRRLARRAQLPQVPAR